MCRKMILGWVIGWGVGMQSHCVIFNLGPAKVCSPPMFETYFSYDKDIWISESDYYMHFYIIIH